MKRDNREKVKRYVLPLIPLSLFFISWELLSATGTIGALISSPTEIIDSLLELSVNTTENGYPVLLVHIFSSLYRLAISYFIALSLGIGFGALVGRSKGAYRFFDPIFTTLMPIPGIAWAPLFIIWLGFGNSTILTVGVLAAFFPIFYNTAAGVRGIDKSLVRAAEIMGVKKWKKFFKVYIPGALDQIITGLKLGLARCWRTIIAVEMIAASLWGLGFMIFDAREYLNPSVVYGGIIVLAVIYYIVENNLFEYLEKKTVEKWGIRRDAE